VSAPAVGTDFLLCCWYLSLLLGYVFALKLWHVLALGFFLGVGFCARAWR
jgi:hypothetical protein